MFYNGDIGSGKLPLNLKAMEGHKMTSPNSEYFFEEESDHISRNEQQEINADRDALDNEPFCLIPLTQGQFAKVSPHIYQELSVFNWFSRWEPHTKKFYAARTIYYEDGRQGRVLMHRQILGLVHGDKRQGDHWNLDTLDNRDGNLRIATHAENQHNSTKYAQNSSGYKGVSWHKRRGKWTAQIRVSGHLIYLGLFVNAKDAHDAYATASKKYHGEFSRPS